MSKLPAGKKTKEIILELAAQGMSASEKEGVCGRGDSKCQPWMEH